MQKPSETTQLKYFLSLTKTNPTEVKFYLDKEGHALASKSQIGILSRSVFVIISINDKVKKKEKNHFAAVHKKNSPITLFHLMQLALDKMSKKTENFSKLC
ncbi:CLUMA_CG011009, isoform A [Clunio marinus]|uniref:CLUMA_CG011009, isoform A n=1 Tax=Clunio marinus TaxID=568069 RepID=A0A1J1IBF9_9DIPT|nr:CLUMA_CG011009, isoform A [Clunio marinus]